MALTLQPLRDWTDVQANFDKVAALLKRLAGIDFGSATAHYAGAVTTANVAVTHALGVVPKTVVGLAQSNTGNSILHLQGAGLAPTNTTLTFAVRDVTGVARTGDEIFYWLALV